MGGWGSWDWKCGQDNFVSENIDKEKDRTELSGPAVFKG